MVVKLYYGAEQLLAKFGDTPSACAGYFGDQLSDMESLEESTDPGSVLSPDVGILHVDKQLPADVRIAESMEQVIAAENGLKQPNIILGSRIKASIASLSDHFSLSEPFHLLVGRRRVIHDRKGFQIPLISGPGNTLELVEIRHAFVHGAPYHVKVLLSFPQTADTKFTRIVDHGLDPQDLAELVIYFQPVVLHTVLDACTGPAVFLAVSEHFTLEVAVQFATQEGKDIVRSQVDGGIVDQSPEQGGELLATGKDHVTAVLRLGNRPVVVENSLGAVSKDEFRTLYAVTELHRTAGLLTAEYGDQSFGDSVTSDDVTDEAFLTELPLAVLVGSALAGGEGLAMVDERFRMLSEHRNKILAKDSQGLVDKGVQMGVAAEREVPLENDSIKTTQTCYNGGGELFDEDVHGVLLPMAV